MPKNDQIWIGIVIATVAIVVLLLNDALIRRSGGEPKRGFGRFLRRGDHTGFWGGVFILVGVGLYFAFPNEFLIVMSVVVIMLATAFLCLLLYLSWKWRWWKLAWWYLKVPFGGKWPLHIRKNDAGEYVTN